MQSADHSQAFNQKLPRVIVQHVSLHGCGVTGLQRMTCICSQPPLPATFTVTEFRYSLCELTLKKSCAFVRGRTRQGRQAACGFVCVFLAIKHRVSMLLFSPEVWLSTGALCMYPEKAGVRWSISEAQPGTAAAPAPHTAQGYSHKTTH